MRRFVTLVALIAFVVPVRAGAQWSGRVGIEGTLGAARVRSGTPFMDEWSLALDATVTGRMRKEPGHSLIAGASLSVFYNGGADAVCRLLPDGSCAPQLPGFVSRTLLSGWEAVSQQKESIRLMLGPSWIRPHYSDTTNVGVQTRLDLGTHMTGRLGLVVSGRWSHLPSYRDRAVNLFAFGVGFRVR